MRVSTTAWQRDLLFATSTTDAACRPTDDGDRPSDGDRPADRALRDCYRQIQAAGDVMNAGLARRGIDGRALPPHAWCATPRDACARWSVARPIKRGAPATPTCGR
jgi:hypothetical protein